MATWSEALDAWVRVGGAALTTGGSAHGARAAGFALDAAARLRDVTGVSVDGPALLTMRAALSGWDRPRPGRSVGGASRIVQTADGALSMTLARPEDIGSLPALFERDDARLVDPDVEVVWSALAHHASDRTAGDLVERAALLGISAAAAGEFATRIRCETTTLGTHEPRAEAMVVDLSALWAGPLCTHLLGLGGATVVKVEDPRRPDGARSGPTSFYDLLHADHDSVALDFASASGRAALQRLCRSADVVVTSARTRAISHLGLDLDALLRSQTISAWVRVTAYGDHAPERVGFGDDAAFAAGLCVGLAEELADGLESGAPTDRGDLGDGGDTGGPSCHGDHSGGPRYLGDAIADPLTGLWAAAETAAALEEGRIVRVDASLVGVAAAAVSWIPTTPTPTPTPTRTATATPSANPTWTTPRSRRPAAALGRDTQRWVP